MMLRSIELVLPDAAGAAGFLAGTWGMALAGEQHGTFYLRGSGRIPYLIALEDGAERFVRSTTFTCNDEELARLEERTVAAGLAWTATRSADPGGGERIVVELPEGEALRFLKGTAEAEPLLGRDLPVKLTHVVLNSAEAERSGRIMEAALGFNISDRTKAMVFLSCNRSHHSIAFTQAGFPSLNHIALEMEDIDAVMRGIGRMRDHSMSPAWGPGRHGPGANVFAYFVTPFGAVLEFSTALEELPDDHRVGGPEDWTWPPNRNDHWGLSNKDTARLSAAERSFRIGA